MKNKFFVPRFSNSQLISSLMQPRVPGHGRFDCLFIYLFLILGSCFLRYFSALFRLQLMCSTECECSSYRSQVVSVS